MDEWVSAGTEPPASRIPSVAKGTRGFPRPIADGNDLAGIRLPDVTAPVATCTGWARAAANDLKARRLLLDEDVEAYVQRAEASQVGR